MCWCKDLQPDLIRATTAGAGGEGGEGGGGEDPIRELDGGERGGG